jgi:hypothetical protein
MASKTAKAPKTKTTAQRVADVRKTILADIRAIDKARRTLERNLDGLAPMLDLGEVATSLSADTHAQLVSVFNTLSVTIAVLNGEMDEKAAKLAGTYTAR